MQNSMQQLNANSISRIEIAKQKILKGLAMLLKQLEIRNFRCIEDISLQLNETAILICENFNDTTIIPCAVDLCMSEALVSGENVFKPSDFHLDDENSDPSEAKPIEIKLVFQETEPGEWSENLGPDLERSVRENELGFKTISLRVSGKFGAESNSIKTETAFIDLEGKILPENDMFTSLQDLQQMVAVCLLSSLREAGQKFLPGSKLWEKIFGESQLSEETLAKIAANMKDLDDKIPSGNKTVKSIVSRLSKISDILSQGSEKLALDEAIPTTLFDSPLPAESNLSSTFNDFLPIATDGAGGQSVASLLLIDAILRAQVKGATSKPAHPILAIERPELHLDMSIQSSITKVLQEIPGQKFITTDSEFILSDFDFRDIIRFDYNGSKLLSHQINPEQMEQGMTEEESRKMWRELKHWRPPFDVSWLLSRCWLFVKGEGEDWVLWDAADSMGINFRHESVSVVKYSYLNLEYLMKLADQFGIKWFLLADYDEDGRDNVKAAQQQLDDREPENHICQLDHSKLKFLDMHGSEDIDEESEENQNEQEITLDNSDVVSDRKQVKNSETSDSNVEETATVAVEIDGQDGSALESQLKGVIKKVVKLSGSQKNVGFLEFR